MGSISARLDNFTVPFIGGSTNLSSQLNITEKKTRKQWKLEKVRALSAGVNCTFENDKFYVPFYIISLYTYILIYIYEISTYILVIIININNILSKNL